jgi:hypothetical protein
MDCVLRLLAPQRGRGKAARGLAELTITPPYDDLSAMRCLRETHRNLRDAYPHRLPKREWAEFCGPDGKLIWDERANADD